MGSRREAIAQWQSDVAKVKKEAKEMQSDPDPIRARAGKLIEVNPLLGKRRAMELARQGK